MPELYFHFGLVGVGISYFKLLLGTHDAHVAGWDVGIHQVNLSQQKVGTAGFELLYASCHILLPSSQIVFPKKLSASALLHMFIRRITFVKDQTRRPHYY